jgi:arachidonate 15-lipoxygenase
MTGRHARPPGTTPAPEPSAAKQDRARALWSLRKRFWDTLAIVKVRFNKPAVIPIPSGTVPPLRPVPLASRFPGIPIPNIRIGDHVPADEIAAPRHYLYALQVWLYRVFSPMQSGLPPIDADPEQALREAYTDAHRRCFPPPVLPREFVGSPDLGLLAVAGPYAGYLERAPGGGYQWDLRELGNYELHGGLRSLGVKVLFRLDEASRRLHPVRIESELGACGPTDPPWALAQRIALCAASTHTSLVRHFNWVHLAAGEPLAIATRNCLPPNHPLCRLIWPHMFGTQSSNESVIRGQMERGGDFDSIFSFTHEGMCRLFRDSYETFRFVVNDPIRDAARRGILGGGFDTPGLSNLVDLFDVMRRHAQRYISAYYETDDDLREDHHVQRWVASLNELVPNGIGDVAGGPVTAESLSRLVGSFMYMATAQHELLGTLLWNYQLWVHVQPARVYRDGRREPLDVYQRLVNANLVLNARRKQLLDDFSSLALDPRGRHAFDAFRQELRALQARMDAEPPAAWKVYPNILEANINS